MSGVIPVTIVDDADMEMTFNYPAVDQLINVSIANDGILFTVTIENASAGQSVETPLSPGGYVVHTADNPIFTNSEPERGNGIKEIAEDGDASVFGDFVAANTGLTVPLSPGVWAVHGEGVNALFDSGSPDRGEGLVAIAEDGDPAALAARAGWQYRHHQQRRDQHTRRGRCTGTYRAGGHLLIQDFCKTR